MVEEGRLEPTEHGLVPKGEGWYVVNAREARWGENDAFGRYTTFEGDVRFPDVGVNIGVLEPGQPACLYHREDNQEDFLVLSGECLLLVEAEERRLRPWDFFHCPAGTEHVLVGAGDRSCVVLALGARRKGAAIFYPVAEVAQEHGASAVEGTDSPKEAYASSPDDRPSAYREGDLPDVL